MNQQSQKRSRPPQRFSRKPTPTKPTPTVPSGTDALRIASLGGFGDVTQNMFVYEYAPGGDFTKSEIIIVDAGAGFPEEDNFGVDLQIPDTTYLADRKARIKGIFITHGHEDHIGAIRFILPVLGEKIPIFAPKLAAALIEARLAETKVRANISIYQDSVPVTRGSFVIDPVYVTHSIPDTFHLAITTPIGTLYHGSDFKLDMLPLDGKQPDLKHMARVGQKGVLALMSDSLGSDHEGFSPSERSIAENFKREITTAKGRVFVTTISSNIVRWGQAIEYAKSVGRKVVIVGMSIDKAIGIAKQLGYVNLTDSDIVPPDRTRNFPDNKLIFLVAGFAGQADSALSKMAMGKHRIKIKPGDKVIFSSPDYIPGTTSDIYNMIDTLSRKGADVVYGEKEELHVSGHGYQKEHAILINLINPKFLLPIGGNYRHLRSYQTMASNLGYPDDRVILPETDQSVTFYANKTYDVHFRIPLRKVLIDGLGVGDVGVTVLRDRRVLAEDGMFSVVMLVDATTGDLVKDPIILSRGFVFMKENTDLIQFLKREAISKFRQVTSRPPNYEYIREQIQAYMETIIHQKTGRQPMVLPLVIEA